MLEVLERMGDVDAAIAELAAEFEVDDEVIRQDLARLCSDLETEGTHRDPSRLRAARLGRRPGGAPVKAMRTARLTRRMARRGRLSPLTGI